MRLIVVVCLCLPMVLMGEYQYLSGFGNEFSSESVAGALPVGQNSPQEAPFGLYAEQLSGTSFTTPRASNRRTWFYRVRPSVVHSPYRRIEPDLLRGDFTSAVATPSQIMWKPLSSKQGHDFSQGLVTIAGSGSAESKTGLAIHLYAATQSMENKCFCNADGDLLLVPQKGILDIQTECGYLQVTPGEICVLPRGFRFRVATEDPEIKGYICEIFESHFELPNLGPIGANGLANPRDFLTPVAAFEDREGPYQVITKFAGQLFQSEMQHSPFDVVAYHGNYVPYKYDLALFCPMNAVGFDHADPSIFTVLTAQTLEPGVAVLDFVIFPPRWSCAEHTFRPPYYHRNTMTEYMGLINGTYEAKTNSLQAGGGTLHSCMSPHGPDLACYQLGIGEDLKPSRVGEGALAFMFETTYMLRLTEPAVDPASQVEDYTACWAGLKSHFSLPRGEFQAQQRGHRSLPAVR